MDKLNAICFNIHEYSFVENSLSYTFMFVSEVLIRVDTIFLAGYAIYKA